MSPDTHALTGAYAADALPDDERRSFEAHLAGCEPCAQEVAELQATAAILGAASYETPPAGMKAAVLAEIQEVSQEPAGAQVERLEGDDSDGGRGGPDGRDGTEGSEHRAERAGRDAGDGGGDRAHAAGTGRGRRPRWVELAIPAAAVVAIAVLALAAVLAGLDARLGEVESAAMSVTDVLAAPDAQLVSVDGPGGSHVQVVVSHARGEAVFVVSGMAPAPHEHTYELWMLDAAGATPAGLFDVDERGRATRVMTGDLAATTAIGVTIEPARGSPQPTTEPIMVVELAG
jgi:anti-sigma factor RsiW